jgi:hypothetical protein
VLFLSSARACNTAVSAACNTYCCFKAAQQSLCYIKITKKKLSSTFLWIDSVAAPDQAIQLLQLRKPVQHFNAAALFTSASSRHLVGRKRHHDVKAMAPRLLGSSSGVSLLGDSSSR